MNAFHVPPARRAGHATTEDGAGIPAMWTTVIGPMLGFGLLRAWFFSVQEPGLVFRDDVLFNAVTWLARGIFPLAMVLVLSARPLSSSMKKVSLPIAALVGALCTPMLLIPVQGMPAYASQVCLALGAASIGWLYVCWSEVFLAARIKDVALSMFLSLIVSALLGGLLPVLPPLVTAAAVTAIPLVTLALLRFVDKSGADCADGDFARNAGHAAEPVSAYAKWFSLLAVYALILGAIHSMSNSEYTSLVGGTSYAIYLWSIVLCSIVLIFGISRIPRLFSLDMLWLIVVIAICLTLLVAMTYREALLPILSVFAGIRFVVCGFMNVQLVNMAQSSRRPPYVMFALGWGVYQLLMALGNVVTFYYFDVAGRSIDMLVTLLLAALTMGSLFLVKIGPLTNVHVGTSAAEAAADQLAGIQTMRVKYGLSERETDIVLLLSQGHTQIHIAETLLISINTVRSHMKSIYTKLGVHCKEELLGILDSLGEEQEALDTHDGTKRRPAPALPFESR